MEQYEIGFWGGFFGTASLMLVGSLVAWARSLRRVAFNASLAALASAFFVVAFLGGLPIAAEDAEARALAHVACLTAVVLAYLLFSILGLLRRPEIRHRCIAVLASLAGGVLLAGWQLPPFQALELGTGLAGLLAIVALMLCIRSALRGDPSAWVSVAGVFCLLLAFGGLSWIALDRAGVSWQVHVVSAVAGEIYLVAISLMLWTRYSYLLELKRVMAYGPSYDPVTRMRSRTEAGQMAGEAFKLYRDDPARVGVMVVSIANLYSLEKLYGQAAVNHALFVSAGRLRRVVPTHVEMGRLGKDGFLFLLRNCKDTGQLIRLAHSVQARLSKPVTLNTSTEEGTAESRQTQWQAELGIGVLRVSKADTRAGTAIAMGRGMSRTAMSYPSRIAWYDNASGEIVGMPPLEP